jgi:NTE family protein
VASSCSLPGVFPPVTIAGRRYMDGGMRSALNADVAVGHDAVLVVSVMALGVPDGVTDPLAVKLAGLVDEELDRLRVAGAQLEIVEPNAELLELSGFGLSLMDFSRTDRAFDCGLRQAADEAGKARRWWGS